MSIDKKAEEFTKELRELVAKHFGDVGEDQVQPLGVKLRQLLPSVHDAADSVTTTRTLTIVPELDTDPPDSD